MTDAAWAVIGAAIVAGLPGFWAWRASIRNEKKATLIEATAKAISEVAAEIHEKAKDIEHQTNSELSKLRGELTALRSAENTSREQIAGLHKLIASLVSAAEDAKQVSLAKATAKPENGVK